MQLQLNLCLFHCSNVQTILNDRSLMQQIHQMSNNMQKSEPPPPDSGLDRRRQQLLQQQAEFDQQISQVQNHNVGHRGLIGNVFAWNASDPLFDSEVNTFFCGDLLHVNISKAIVSLPLMGKRASVGCL